MKKIVKKMFRLFGLEVKGFNIHSSEDFLLNHILRKYKVQTIIDVGANEGQYAEGLFENGFRGEIYSFEPLLVPFKELNRKSKNMNNWHVFNLGVGSKEEEIVMNVSENLVSSSIFGVEKKSVEAEPETKIIGQEKIKLTIIDSFFEAKPFQPEAMLKLDIQGYELEALKGSLQSLSKFKLIQVELSFVPLYEGAPSYSEIVDFLVGKGYSLFTIIPGFRDPESGQMLQADGIFLRQ